MDSFEKEASILRDTLERYIASTGVPFSAFENAGYAGIIEAGDQSDSQWPSIYSHHLPETLVHIPDFVIRAMCLGAAQICIGLKAHSLGDAESLNILLTAASEIGFIAGAAYAVINEDAVHRQKMSANGKIGANSRRKNSSEFKEWALQQAKTTRGGDKDIARTLAKKIPAKFDDVSKDHERLIYDALRASKRASKRKPVS